MNKQVVIPSEILSRLVDVGIDAANAPVERIVEECVYVAAMIREGGSNYDDSPASERRTLLRQCDRYLAAHGKRSA